MKGFVFAAKTVDPDFGSALADYVANKVLCLHRKSPVLEDFSETFNQPCSHYLGEFPLGNTQVLMGALTATYISGSWKGMLTIFSGSDRSSDVYCRVLELP